jgi:hypothetical protein
MKNPEPIRLRREIESPDRETERTEELKLTKLQTRLEAALQQQQRLFAQAS